MLWQLGDSHPEAVLGDELLQLAPFFTQSAVNSRDSSLQLQQGNETKPILPTPRIC
jgi:hypothetical protein